MARSLKQRLRAEAGPIIHFHSGDDRFCGARGLRRFTVEPNDVTCKDCQSKDRLWITPQGLSVIAP